ncbi:hypothetical protein CH63R_08949 [Colletotrichum higginsianum IMI 349063]|uniref:Uncharacterized protein n=1 Tax=Colletotrichum higginsianum (strain IMI 349063) TaxID=759273 RepID=A0A1B7Y602_COLHI|nr:hypothetical protein CH63R_08949 [Colletotrichum higginsianum IMI 349063]OBR07428.1 hypothetical protein CH63R_08949 [Colletotrichum higginsianum IMI 349063]
MNDGWPRHFALFVRDRGPKVLFARWRGGGFQALPNSKNTGCKSHGGSKIPWVSLPLVIRNHKRLDPKPHTSHEARQSGERTNPPSLSFLTPLQAFTDQSSSRKQRGTESDSPQRGVCGVRLFDLLPSLTQNSNHCTHTPFLAHKLHFQLGNAAREKEEGPSPPQSIVDR